MVKHPENENMLWLMVEENYSFVLTGFILHFAQISLSSCSKQFRFYSEVSLKLKLRCYVCTLASTE